MKILLLLWEQMEINQRCYLLKIVKKEKDWETIIKLWNKKHNVNELAVNEQNPDEKGFYEHMRLYN